MHPVIRKISEKLESQGGFLRSVSILVGGTAFAQIIGVIVLPLLTRLYTPEDFANFAVYSSLLGILTVAICLRFEIAIPLPNKDTDALCLVIIAFMSNICLTLLIAVLIFFFKGPMLKLINQPQLDPFIWLVPIGILFSGFYNTLQYWVIRKREFNIVAKTKMTQSIFGSAIQVCSGVYGLNALGLIVGQVVNISSGSTKLFKNFYKEAKNLIDGISLNRIKKNWKDYDKFPKYSTFESLANVTAIQLPIVIIAATATNPEAGYLMLAMKVIAMPIALIGSAIGQVYLAHAPEHYSKGKLKKYTLQTISKISKIAIIPICFIGLSAPYIFPLVFGAEWVRAGSMLLWMVPWFIMQVLSSPVSMSLVITEHQKTALLLQLSGLLLRVGGLLLVGVTYPKLTFEYYALSGFIFYSIYLAVIIKALKDS